MESTTSAAVEPLRLSTPVRQLRGVGTRRAEILKRLGIHSVLDLLRHLPSRYEFESSEGTISDLPMDGIGSTRGTIVNTRLIPGRKSGRFQATLQDHQSRLDLVWFNANYLREKLHPGMLIRVQGKVKVFNGYPQMANPKWEPLDETNATPVKVERLRPVYPATEDLPSSKIEALITSLLSDILTQIVDPLPADFVAKHAMPGLADAYRMAHQPKNEEEFGAARRRLAYNELLILQVGIALRRHHYRTAMIAPPLRWSLAIDEHIRKRFPFPLTSSQEKAINEIAADLKQSKPMNRLLQGDVGAGKTAVALYALLLAVANRKQGALMAPTELLAEQHFRSISQMLKGANVQISLLTSSRLAGAARNKIEADIEAGMTEIVIGTQALLTETIRFNDLAVVVVDEQHRFGVMQRATFRSRAADNAKGDYPFLSAASPNAVKPQLAAKNPSPHYLVMTATPIPRTLSLTIFGDLDISTIHGLLPGRQSITSRVVAQDKADTVYRYISERLLKGEQAYVVVPTIDASGKESAVQLKSVTTHAKNIQDKYFSQYRVAAVHGRMKRDVRESIMDRFRAGKIDVLVATTVIEVGVDVPNANLMVIEHAERFGLAQLHQLRGRVGRGSGGRKALCVFIADAKTDDAVLRMKAISETTDGFKIAEQDFLIRGMGKLFGTEQHGSMDLRVAKLPDDMDLMNLARHDAAKIVEADPTLHEPMWDKLRKVLMKEHGNAIGLVDVG